MTRYVWRGGRFVEPETGQPMDIPERGAPALPFFMSDVPEYVSPLSGKTITSRSERREEMRQFNVIEAGDGKPRKAKTERIARKFGIPWEGDD
jgi:hypothetical protein